MGRSTAISSTAPASCVACNVGGFETQGADCLIVGSGGVGAAIAAALAGAGAKSICLSDVTPGSAEALASRLNQYFKRVEIRVGSNDPAGYRLVNGTPLGMSPDDPLPLDVRRLASMLDVGE